MMNIVLAHIKVLLMATVIAVLSATSAWGFTPSVYCEGSEFNSICEFHIADSLILESSVGNTINGGNNRYELSGTVVIVSGTSRFPMRESDFVLDLSDEPEIYGTAMIPFDKMSGLENAKFEKLPRVVVGLVQGKNIDDLAGKDIPINDGVAENGSQRASTVPYFVFHMETGITMQYDFGKDLEALNNFKFTMPGSTSVTAIYDPVDPYVYWSFEQSAGIDLNGAKKQEEDGATIYDISDDDGNVMIRYTQTDSGELYEDNFVTGEMISYTRDADGNYAMDGGDPSKPLVLDGKQFNGESGKRLQAEDDKKKTDDDKKGSGAGIDSFGLSVNGWIPYSAQNADGLPDDVGAFSGQLVFSGTIPMGGGVNLEGDVVTYIGENGFAQGGNGKVKWGLPFLPSFISFDIELGEASAALKVTDEEQMTFVSGELAPDVEFLADILPIMPKIGAKVQGYIGSDLNNAFVSIEGEMGMGADTFGEWIGIDLNSLNMTTARIELNAEGFSIDGKTVMQIHPAIQINTEISVHASMSWIDPDDILLRLSGDMDIFGVALEDVTVEISSQGMFVNGAFVTPLTRIAMSGEIGAGGAQIAGSGSIMFSLADITVAMQKAYDDMTLAQAEVDKINNDIAYMRTIVKAEQQYNSNKLVDARRAVNAAKKTLASINKNIAYEYRMIKTRNKQISSWYRWYKKAAWYQKASRWVSYSYQKSWRKADIAGRYIIIQGYKVSKGVASLALDVASSVLEAAELAAKILPVDADPRIVSLFAAKETANAVLEVAKAPFGAVPYIDFEFAADIALSLGTAGIDGSVSAQINAAAPLQGSLVFNPRFEACFDIPSFGEACTKL